MSKQLTLEYWADDGWYVGRLKEVPGVFSQGETLEELEENIRDAYPLMLEEVQPITARNVQYKEIRKPQYDKNREYYYETIYKKQLGVI